MRLCANNLSYSTPTGLTLFQNLNFDLVPGRTGLVGNNGCGKSTLLSVLAGEVAASSGGVEASGTILRLGQLGAHGPTTVAADLAKVTDAFDVLKRIESAQGSNSDFDNAEWDLPARWSAITAAMGMQGVDPYWPASRLSGGQCARLNLAAPYLAKADIVLLDEPSNNLDRAGRLLLQEFVDEFEGILLVASHDRELLRLMDRMLELQGGKVRSFGGNYDDYDGQARAALDRAEAAADVARRELKAAERAAQRTRERQARRDSAGRKYAASGSAPKLLLHAMAQRAEATAAKSSRLTDKTLELARQRLRDARSDIPTSRSANFHSPESTLAQGQKVLELSGACLLKPGTSSELFAPCSFALHGRQRARLTGPNGVGKSTLLRTIANRGEPASGTITLVRPVVFLDQQLRLLDARETLVEAFRRLNPGSSQQDAQAELASAGFRNAAALKTVEQLSGGERMRVAIACALYAGGGERLVVLDEPTNHLDLASIQALEHGLSNYRGPLLFVTHDEAFAAALAPHLEVQLQPRGAVEAT